MLCSQKSARIVFILECSVRIIISIVMMMMITIIIIVITITTIIIIVIIISLDLYLLALFGFLDQVANDKAFYDFSGSKNPYPGFL